MISVNNHFFHPSIPTSAAEEPLEELQEFVTQDNLEHFSPEHHASIAESTDLTKKEILETKDEASLSLGSNAMGMALGFINIDEGIDGVKDAAKNKDSSGFVNSFFRTFKGFFEIIEKTLSSSKNFIEGSRLFSLNPTSSIILGSTITAGASGAALSLLVMSSLSVLEKRSLAKKHLDLLDKGAKDPAKTQEAIESLKNELFISDKERKTLLDSLLKQESSIDRFKDFVMDLFAKNPLLRKCKQALLHPSSHDLKALAGVIKEQKKSSSLCLTDGKFQEKMQALSEEDRLAYEQILIFTFSKVVDQLQEKKSSSFTKLFGEDVKTSLLEMKKEGLPPASKSKEILVKASSHLTRELERSVIKLFGALLVAATTVLAQVATEGAFYIAETALCLCISACALLAEIYALAKCIRSNHLSLQEKIKTSLVSVLMMSLIASSSVILRLTLSPIATGILTVSWLLMTCFTVYLWLAKKHHHKASENLAPGPSSQEVPPLVILDKLC